MRDDPWLERQLRSLTRSRLVFGLLAVVVPSGLYAQFERQARLLDALADHGRVGTATVDRVSPQGVDYSYKVEGSRYTWDVRQEEAPYAVGETFPIVYVPEHPALNRPGSDRSRAAAEAASNRSFARKAVAGLFAFLFAVAILCHVQLQTLRKRGRAVLDDPRAYRRRLVGSGVLLLPLLALIFGWHARDAASKDESLWPVVLGVVVALSILGGTVFYVARQGPTQARVRAARLTRWVFPLAMGIAALRAIAWLAGWS